MLGCSKIAPEEQFTSYIPPAHRPNLVFRELQNTVIIKMYGMGSRDAFFCKQLPQTNVRFINQPYDSKGIFNDIKQLFQNAKNFPFNDHERIYLLMSTLRYYLQMNRFTSIYLIPVSHASVVAHAAVLKLKTDPKLYGLITSKLHIFTVSSPRYLPAGFLEKGRLLNFYHIKDPYLPLLRFFKCFNVPSKIKWTAPGFILYNEQKALVITNKESIQQGSRVEKYHVSLLILDYIIDPYTIYYLSNITEMDSIFTPCPVTYQTPYTLPPTEPAHTSLPKGKSKRTLSPGL